MYVHVSCVTEFLSNLYFIIVIVIKKSNDDTSISEDYYQLYYNIRNIIVCTKININYFIIYNREHSNNDY